MIAFSKLSNKNFLENKKFEKPVLELKFTAEHVKNGLKVVWIRLIGLKVDFFTKGKFTPNFT